MSSIAALLPYMHEAGMNGLHVSVMLKKLRFALSSFPSAESGPTPVYTDENFQLLIDG